VRKAAPSALAPRNRRRPFRPHLKGANDSVCGGARSIHAAAGDWPVKPSPPFTPGHEGVGIVEETGPLGPGARPPGLHLLTGRHESRHGPFGKKILSSFPNGPWFLQSARPGCRFRSAMELNPHWRPLLELPFGATAELGALRDAELPLGLLEVLPREAATQRRWRLLPACSLMMRNTWRYLACVGRCICGALKSAIPIPCRPRCLS
jgi:hypothetical protein